MDTFDELNAIFCKVFDDEDIKINREYTVNDIDGWDSLSHANLAFAVEKHFGVVFQNSEIEKWKNVGEMYESLLSLLQQKDHK